MHGVQLRGLLHPAGRGFKSGLWVGRDLVRAATVRGAGGGSGVCDGETILAASLVAFSGQ